MDATVDIANPEALVYELDPHGAITGLVAHEYTVPVDAWTAAEPPSLFEISFHRHPTLPLWVLHAWLWKDNPTGVFQDWNPRRQVVPGRREDLRCRSGRCRPRPVRASVTAAPGSA